MDTIIPQKRCTGCNQNLPATTEYFHTDRSKTDLLHTRCKNCQSIAKHKRRLKNHPPDILPEGHKRCTHCKQVKPATTEYFFANKGMPDGLNYWCKKCRKTWGEEHPEFIAYDPIWRKNHYETHKERTIKEQCAYAKTKAGKASRTRYRKTHAEQCRTHVRNRRARIKAIPGMHTAQEILAQYQRQKGKCYYCNENIPWGKHQVDHTIPVHREGARNSIDHLVIACGTCNRKKGDKCPWEWPEGNRLL